MPYAYPNRTSVVGIAAVCGVLISATAASAAGDRYRRYDDGPRYVVAESQWGNGTVSGPVRYGRVGREVRMPGGTWIDCGRSCSETLRRATVDFWQAQGKYDAKDSGPGYLRWQFGR